MQHWIRSAVAWSSQVVGLYVDREILHLCVTHQGTTWQEKNLNGPNHRVWPWHLGASFGTTELWQIKVFNTVCFDSNSRSIAGIR